MILVHYGSDKYDPALFQPIEDDTWIKPKGGLWTSPANCEESWKAWCIAEDFACKSLDKHFHVQFEGKLLVIDSVDDLNKLAWRCYPGLVGHYYISFEEIKREWDAIHLTAKGQWDTRFSRPYSLYGWDCETVLILNPNSIKPYEESNQSSVPAAS